LGTYIPPDKSRDSELSSWARWRPRVWSFLNHSNRSIPARVRLFENPIYYNSNYNNIKYSLKENILIIIIIVYRCIRLCLNKGSKHATKTQLKLVYFGIFILVSYHAFRVTVIQETICLSFIYFTRITVSFSFSLSLF